MDGHDRGAKIIARALRDGGTIPKVDIPALKKQGVAEVFGPGTPLDAIVEFLRKNVKPETAKLWSGRELHGVKQVEISK